MSSLKESLNPSAQSDNNLTIVYQVIVPGASVGTLRYSSGVSRVYFVNLYSFTPLPIAVPFQPKVNFQLLKTQISFSELR